ncbi:MAG: hypothetical protein V7609_1908 [Verrucomicrobiota bacterium]
MLLKLSFPAFLGRLDKWLLAILVALSVGCNAPENEPTVASSPTPASSSPAASPAESSPAILTLSPANGFEGVTQGGNTTISRTSEGLGVQSAADPYILLPRLPVTAKPPLSVRIQFVNPVPPLVQIFYDTKEHRDGWDEPHSVRKPTQKGQDDITIDITDSAFGGRIRVDPGDLGGEYVIKLIEVRPR